MPERRWTQSMVEAWQWAVSSLEQGMTVAEGLASYRAGGGHIATTDWNYIRARAREAASMAEEAQGIIPTEILPESVYTVVDIDYGQKYVAVAEIQYTDAQTGEEVKRHITVESDLALTMEDWQDAIYETGSIYGVEGGYAGIEITSLRFYSPMWTHIPV